MVTPVLRTLAILFLLVAACEGASPVTLKSRSGYTGHAGQRFRFSIGIEQDARNRHFCLEWASQASEGRSCDDLDAERAPRTIWRDVTFRTGGEYNVIAWVRQSVDGADRIVKSNIETIILTDVLGQ